MKIVTINVVKESDFIKKARATKGNVNVGKILTHLKENPTQKFCAVTVEEMKNFDRYSLQRALQRAGQHVTIDNGTSKATNKPILIIERLSDEDWKAYVENLKRKQSERAGKGKKK